MMRGMMTFCARWIARGELPGLQLLLELIIRRNGG
jgi:hypothetical protein